MRWGFSNLSEDRKKHSFVFILYLEITTFKDREKQQRERSSSGMCTNTFSILGTSSVLLLKVRGKEINTPQPKRLETSNKGQFYTEPWHLVLFGKLIFLKQAKCWHKPHNQSYFVLWECWLGCECVRAGHHRNQDMEMHPFAWNSFSFLSDRCYSVPMTTHRTGPCRHCWPSWIFMWKEKKIFEIWEIFSPQWYKIKHISMFF